MALGVALRRAPNAVNLEHPPHNYWRDINTIICRYGTFFHSVAEGDCGFLMGELPQHRSSSPTHQHVHPGFQVRE